MFNISFDGKPNGAFNIAKLRNILKVKEKTLQFNFEGAEREFQLKAKNQIE